MNSKRWAVIFASVLLAPTVSYADCADELREVLRSNLNSGPYEMRTQMVVRNAEGVVLRESDTIRQIVFPDRMRVVGGDPRSSTSHVEEVLVDGTQWLRKGNKWEAVPAAPLKETLQRIRRDGFLSIPIGNVQCNGLGRYQGRLLRDFTSEVVRDGVSFLATVYVDPSTHLPVASKESVTGKLAAKTETTFRFVADLSIKAPRN